jgi:serine/threonine protein kinase
MKYILEKQIGEGSFGKIFLGSHKRTGEKVAIKVEPYSHEIKTLKYETQIYQSLGNIEEDGFLKVKWFGLYQGNYYMVLPLLGKSLKKLQGVFSLDFVIDIGKKIIKLLKILHELGFIHRDVKPDNFLFDISGEILYIIDFGICKKYTNKERKCESFIGTREFASKRVKDLWEPARRDDLESVAYILNYLLGRSSGFEKYIATCQALAFCENPNYDDLCSEII